MTVREARLAALTRMRERRTMPGRVQAAMPIEPVAAGVAALLGRDLRRVRDAVRRRQRLHGHARHARRGPAVARPGVLPQRLPRDVADSLRRGRVRLRDDRPDDRLGPRRLGHAAVRRRGAARPVGVQAAVLRARAGHARGHARALGHVPHRARRRRRAALAAARVAALAPPRGDLLRGHARLRRGRARDRLRARHPPAAPEGRRRPARRRAHDRLRADAGLAVLRRHARRARAAHALQRHGPGVRHGALDRDRAAPQHRVVGRGGRGPRRLLPRRRARHPDARDEAARLPPRRARGGGRPLPARQPHAGPRRRRRLRAHRRGPARAPGRVLGALGHRDRGPRRHPAGGPLQPLPGAPGVGARRGPRDRRQGADRPRLRGPVLLGHGDLRAAVPDLHAAARRPAAAALPLRDARRRAPARRAARPPRRAVSVAHDLRRGGVGVLRRRHRPVPHQRRDLLRRAPVRARHRRPGVPRARGRRDPRRDGPLLGRPRLLLCAPRRAVLHPGRDRARRVLGGRRQQRLHEPHGAREPVGRRRVPAAAARTPIPRRTRASSRG